MTDRDRWVVALLNAARAAYAERTGDAPDGHGVTADPCPGHGPACVRVVYGSVVRHVRWGEHDPGGYAAGLLPPAEFFAEDQGVRGAPRPDDPPAGERPPG